MACDIQKLAEYILANREIAKDALWNKVNEVMGQPSKSYIAPEVKSNSKLPVELINPEHHEFNKLPFYKEGQKTMTYAGIGSRVTPDEVLEVITKAAQWLESKGYKLQTGYKRKTGDRIKEEGADKAFSIGTKNKELFGPDMANDKTIAIAHEVYPNLKGMWEHTYNKWVETVGETKAKEYADGAINLQARNTFQVFGASLDTPVDFVLFYAEETSNPLRPKGGTGQAVEMARRKGIPTINMVNKDWRKQLEEVLQFKKSDNDTKVGLDDNNTTTLEEELTYLNSKKTIKGTLSQKGQKVDFQLADGDTATGVIHQMLDGTMLGYADGKITELASGKYVITYKGGSVKDKFTEAITKLKTVSGDNKTAVEQAIKEGTFNKDIPKSRVLKMAIDVRKERIKKTVNEPTEYDAEFSKELDKKLRVLLKKLYPEIRLKYTKTEIDYIDNKSNIKNQKNLVGYNAKFAAEHEFDYFIKTYGKVNSGYGILSDMSYYDAEDMSNSELKAMQDRARALLEEYREDLEEIGVYSYFAHFWLNDGDSSWDTVNNIPFTFDEYVKNPKNNRLTQGKIYKNFKGEISSHIRKQIQYFIHKATKLRTKKGIAEKLSKEAEENGYVRLPVKRIVTEHEIDVLNKYSSALKLVGMGDTKRIEDVSIIDREQLIQLFHDSPAVQKLIAIVDSLGVRFITDSSDENIMDFGDTLAYYSPGLTPTVVFPKYSRKRDIIHELIHALLDTKNSKKSDLEEAASLLEQSDKGAELFEVFKKSKRENYTEYARKDYREFLAELFSNKAVMDHAKGITTNKDFILNIKALIRNKKMENGNNLLIKLIKETMSENIKEFQGTLLGDMLKLAFDTTKFEYNEDLTLKDRSTQILYQLSNVSENVQRIKGQADIEAKTVLINSLLQSQDTLPHEYAHHYIAWFRDATIVQEAIKKWGSEEALVQAIGEQVVKQKGEAYGWWKEFSSWLKGLFIGLDKASKEDLVQLLTDAFLTRQDLDTRDQKADIIKSSKIQSKTVEKAVEARNTRIKKVAKNMWWKRYAAETKQVPGKYNDYYGAMEKTITKIMDPKVVTNVVGLMLEDVFNGKFQIVAGDYDPDTHTVQIAEKPRQMEIEMAVEEGLQEEAIRLYEDTTENMAYRAKLIEDYVNKNRANALAYVISSVESVNGGHTTTHELIHAGSVNFMRDPKNANHPAVLRVKELYQEALNRESDIKSMMRTGDVYTEYWKKSEEEFISEALSNPQLMYALSNIKTVGKERLSKGLFAELVESLIKMLGLSKKTEGNLLEFTMDGFAAIMEAQAVELNRNSNVPAKIYHGFKGNITPYINKEGNLVMKPSKNFGGKTTSVSFTHSLDTAYRYAAQVKGEGPLGYDFINAKVFEIETKYIDELLQRESQEEWAINTDKDVVIPKRAFKVIEHPLTSRLGEVEKEYPFKEFVRDVTMDHEFDGYGDERSYGNYFEEYLDSVIAEYDKDPELAKDIYDTMEYLSDGDYADLAITSESEVAQDKRDTMTVKEILAKVDKMREECE